MTGDDSQREIVEEAAKFFAEMPALPGADRTVGMAIAGLALGVFYELADPHDAAKEAGEDVVVVDRVDLEVALTAIHYLLTVLVGVSPREWLDDEKDA